MYLTDKLKGWRLEKQALNLVSFPVENLEMGNAVSTKVMQKGDVFRVGRSQ